MATLNQIKRINQERTVIHISAKNKYILEKYVKVNYFNEYPIKVRASLNDLISYLILKEVGIFYGKIVRETEEELAKHHK